MRAPPMCASIRAMEDNPVYRHLTQDFHQLSCLMMGLLIASVGVFGGSTAVVAAYYVEANRGALAPIALMVALGLSSVGFIFVAPSFALMIAMLFTKKSAPQQGLAILWLTNISAQQIADGYIAAVERRLCTLRVIGLSLIPQTVAIFAYLIGSTFVIIDCIGPSGFVQCGSNNVFVYLFYGTIPAVFVVGMLAVVGILLLQLATATGIWVAFRWREKAPIMAAGILLDAWVVLILLMLPATQSYIVPAAINYVIAATVAIPILWALVWFARRGVRRAVKKIRQVQ